MSITKETASKILNEEFEKARRKKRDAFDLELWGASVFEPVFRYCRKEVNEMKAAKCDECGAYADEMSVLERIIFRYRNGDRKTAVLIYFYKGDGTSSRELCKACKAKLLRKAADRLKEGGD